MFRRVGIIGLITLALATVSSGCTPQVTEASGGGAGGNTPGSATPTATTEKVTDWWGGIKRTEPGAQYDDYFERQDQGQVTYLGIDSTDPAVQAQIVALRDSGRVVHLYGTLLSNVPDYNGSQIQVEHIVVEEPTPGSATPAAATEKVTDWWGVIKRTEPGAQYDDYFERQDQGQVTYLGIDSTDPTVQSQIVALRDSGRVVHLYGTLLSNVPDYNGSQIRVEHIVVEEQTPGSATPAAATEKVTDWWGIIKRTEPGAQYDDYFERQDQGQVIYYGIDSTDPAVQSQIVALRDSGRVVHLYGTLLGNVPDYNGSQIQVEHIVVEEQTPGSVMPPGATEEITNWWGVIRGTEPGAQYDDYFERRDLGQVIYFGIDSTDPTVESQIVALRNSGKIVHLYGTLLGNVPDYNGSQIQVERIEVEK